MHNQSAASLEQVEHNFIASTEINILRNKTHTQVA